MTTTTHPSNPPATAEGFAETQLGGANLAYWFTNEPPNPGSEHQDGVYLTAEIPGVQETLVIWVKYKQHGTCIYKKQLIEGTFHENK
jgi:hypothetical protein